MRGSWRWALSLRAAVAREAGAPRDVVVPPASPPGEDAGNDAPVVVPLPSEKALRYHRSGNVIWLVEQLFGLALPAVLLFAGWSGRLCTFAAGIGRGHFYPTLVVYLVLLSALLFVAGLPLSYYVGYVREHAYGLSTQRLSKWAGDQAKGWVLSVLLGALALWVPYLLLKHSPSRWWLWTGALSLPFFTLLLLDRARLHRAAVQQVRSHEGQGA